ncbi:hypothetical protein POKO110462_11845 [Pontibacter korlensis]
MTVKAVDTVLDICEHLQNQNGMGSRSASLKIGEVKGGVRCKNRGISFS